MRRFPLLNDRGSATLEAVLVIPRLMLALFVAVQLVPWSDDPGSFTRPLRRAMRRLARTAEEINWKGRAQEGYKHHSRT